MLGSVHDLDNTACPFTPESPKVSPPEVEPSVMPPVPISSVLATVPPSMTLAIVFVTEMVPIDAAVAPVWFYQKIR